MDINCTDNCEHQHEGKCGLVETPDVFVSSAGIDNESKSDCPYFTERASVGNGP